MRQARPALRRAAPVRRPTCLWLIALCALALWPIASAPGPAGAFGPAHAQDLVERDVDLELVLLADASGSIDDAEIAFQRRGYAEAITDPQVLSAIRSGGFLGRIAVAYVEWASAPSQEVVVDWMVIEDAASAQAFADRLVNGPPRATFGGNAIGSALLRGKDMIDANAHEGYRKVLDLSADSMWNGSGPSIPAARAEVLAAGITINGLAVLCRTCSGRPVGYDLEEAFATGLIGGPGAFVVTADSPATFADAVRRKLVLEIAGRTPPAPDDAAAPVRPAALR